jgi:hypothetical protein
LVVVVLSRFDIQKLVHYFRCAVFFMLANGGVSLSVELEAVRFKINSHT